MLTTSRVDDHFCNLARVRNDQYNNRRERQRSLLEKRSNEKALFATATWDRNSYHAGMLANCGLRLHVVATWRLSPLAVLNLSPQ